MILYHSAAEISTNQGLRVVSLSGAVLCEIQSKLSHDFLFNSTLCLSAFVVNITRTNKKLTAEEPNATRKINSIDLRLRLHFAARVTDDRLPAGTNWASQ